MAKKIDLAEGLTHFKAKENASIAITEATSTASAPHKAGEYFYYKGDLVIATADIAQGGTITLNTNCKKQPLADSVCELKTAITEQSEAVDTLEGYFAHSKNMVNPSTISANTVISSAGAVNTSTSNDTSDYIPVKGGNYYSWKNLNYVARYNATKGWVGRTSGTSQSKLWFTNDGYVRVCGNTGTADSWRFNIGEAVVDEPYYKDALSNDVKLLNHLDEVKAEITDIDNIAVPTYGVPFSPAIPYHYTGDPIIPYKTSGHLQDIYDLFDDLVEEYPDYITKSVLGKDASNTYDMNLYTISNGTNYAYRLPRFVWISNIHGNEGNSSISAYYFAKELLTKFTTDPCCYAIMSAYTVYIIPCANPWGVENYSRLNSNNVNLNRNFPADWVYRDPTLAYGVTKYGIESASNGSNQYYYYGGGTVVYDDSTQTATTTYVAEAETTLIMNFVNSINTGNNLHGKIAFAVNKHDSGTMSEEGATILVSDNFKADREFIKNLTDWLKPLLMGTQNWLTEKSGLNLATVKYSLHSDEDVSGTMDKWFNAKNIHGCLCEIPKSAGTSYQDTEHYSDLCAINVDFAINLIANTIVNNARLKDNTQTETYTIVT